MVCPEGVEWCTLIYLESRGVNEVNVVIVLAICPMRRFPTQKKKKKKFFSFILNFLKKLPKVEFAIKNMYTEFKLAFCRSIPGFYHGTLF